MLFYGMWQYRCKENLERLIGTGVGCWRCSLRLPTELCWYHSKQIYMAEDCTIHQSIETIWRIASTGQLWSHPSSFCCSCLDCNFCPHHCIIARQQQRQVSLLPIYTSMLMTLMKMIEIKILLLLLLMPSFLLIFSDVCTKYIRGC